MGEYGERIAHGVKSYRVIESEWVERRADTYATFMVLTRGDGLSKPEYVKRQDDFIRKIRRDKRTVRLAKKLGVGVRQVTPWRCLLDKSGRHRDGCKLSGGAEEAVVEYGNVYEQQASGAHHSNIVLWPVPYIDVRELASWWGGHISIERVRDGEAVAAEQTKKWYSVNSLASYMVKADQQEREGRRVSFSAGWPKVPPVEESELVGDVKWSAVWKHEERLELAMAWADGSLIEAEPGLYIKPEWAFDMRLSVELWREGLSKAERQGEYMMRMEESASHLQCNCFERVYVPRAGPGEDKNVPLPGEGVPDG